jgi:hypothetical protein
MKKFTFLLIIVFSLYSSLLSAQKSGKLTVKTVFAGIIEGYDHINKTQLFVDGSLAGESPEGLESKTSSFSVDISRGSHTIRLVNLAKYEGNWEEHTRENEYSLDAVYETTLTIKKKKTVDVVFDIEKEETRVKIK